MRHPSTGTKRNSNNLVIAGQSVLSTLTKEVNPLNYVNMGITNNDIQTLTIK